MIGDAGRQTFCTITITTTLTGSGFRSARAETDVFCAIQGGVLKSYSLSQLSEIGEKESVGELSFVQSSDSPVSISQRIPRCWHFEGGSLHHVPQTAARQGGILGGRGFDARMSGK